MRRARFTAKGALEHEHEVARQSVRGVRRNLNNVRNPSTRRSFFFNLYVGLHGSGWLYVLGMPPRGYFPDFATLKPQSTRHGARPRPKLAPWFEACSLPAPQPRAREKTRGRRSKNADVQKGLISYMVIQGSPSGSGVFPAG